MCACVFEKGLTTRTLHPSCLVDSYVRNSNNRRERKMSGEERILSQITPLSTGFSYIIGILYTSIQQAFEVMIVAVM